ncbi:NADH-quinone oxidoreductase subunit L [Schlesneria paludicola]|uniref:NADH-quinone oxidoreductase subunit L n=1 Tax=Schlesneria paludicola TaxID=360056 RepID=UPI00058E7C85|nr:NADH-quinone oxidoreductase subunit L [Schlesneria paludicola]
MTEWLKENVIWLIPTAPLLACAWIVLVGHVIRRKYAHRPLVLGLAISFAASLYLLSVVVPSGFGHEEHEASHAIVKTVYQWIKIGTIDVPIILRADAMSALMLTMVTSVSLLVAIFASSYMTGDPGYPRFFAAMSLFVFSMCMLVLSGNFLMMFVFWEAVGLCSYLLIGFWFHKPSAAAAAKKAFVVNRIGDFGFILGILLIWLTFGTLDFGTLFESPDAINRIVATQPTIFTAICALLFVGAVGKSAQFPLQVWLPDAMEGPTPVSALIHAATMVTAGVYLVARCTPFFVHAPSVQLIVSIIGAATALIAAITALTQYDLKRVLAYSTVSQLGYMFMALGAAGGGEGLATHAVTFAMFHMFTHAFFKAVLFLAAGSVMHAMGDVIDMRRFSGLRKALPITHWTFLAGALALSGFPLLSGFWSKDEILAVLVDASQDPTRGQYYQMVLGVALLTSLMTAFYTFRAYFMTFWGEEKFPEEAGHHPHDAPPAMAGPLAILAIAALFIGAITGPTELYGHYLHHTPGLPEAHHFDPDYIMMGISTILALGGIGVAYLFYVVSPGIPQNLKRGMSLGFNISHEGLYIDWCGYKFVAGPLRAFATVCELFDRWVVDTIVDCFGFIPGLFGSIIRPIQNGMVQNYGTVMMIGLIVCLISVLRALAGTM